MKLTVLKIIAGFVLAAFSLSFAAFIPADRMVTWEGNVGIPGGIPGRTTVFATIDAATYGNGTTDAKTAIQNAINSCPKDQVVYLPAGTYLVSGGLIINHPMVLRGAGADKTILNINGRIMVSPYDGGYADGGWGKMIDWTAGYTKGSTVLTLASVTGLSVGRTVILDQHNDTSIVHVPGNGGIQSTYSRSDSGFIAYGKNRAQGQLVKIVSINSSTNQVTIDVPLCYTFKSALLPQVYYWESGNMEYAGIENLKIDAKNNSYRAIEFNYCSNSWVRGVEIANPARAAIGFVIGCYRPVVRDCYIHDSQLPFGPSRYGIELGWVSAALVENNIVSRVVAPILTSSWVGGSVIAYNYTRENTFHNGPGTYWQFCSIEPHMCHSFQNLLEGNIATAIAFDVVWGSGSHSTTFRNRIHGYDPPDSAGYWINNTNAVIIEAWNRYMNFVGNVLGTTGWHKYYELDPANYAGEDDRKAVYILGKWNYLSNKTDYDPVVKSTLLRGGNHDAATGKVIWKSNVPAGEDTSTYLGQQALPASLYLPAKPAWWNSSPWPAIGPDVSNGNLAGASGYANKIPACDCYEKSPKAVNGDVLFNADYCYGAGNAVIPRAPINGKSEQSMFRGNGIRIYTVSGQKIDARHITQNGIYLVKKAGSNSFQKMMVLR